VHAGGKPYFDWRKGVTGRTNPILRHLYNEFRADQDH
jgi:hypothetical protein